MPSDVPCTACALVCSGRSDGDRIAENEHGAVLLNRFASREGHLMVIARNHVEHVHEIPWSAYLALQRLAYEAIGVLQRHYEPARIFSAVLGSPMPLLMSYPHLHIHVVPVMEDDERARPARVFSWSEGVVMYDDGEAKALVASLRTAWPVDS